MTGGVTRHGHQKRVLANGFGIVFLGSFWLIVLYVLVLCFVCLGFESIEIFV